MKGRDGSNWVVATVSNGTKRWKKMAAGSAPVKRVTQAVVLPKRPSSAPAGRSKKVGSAPAKKAITKSPKRIPPKKSITKSPRKAVKSKTTTKRASSAKRTTSTKRTVAKRSAKKPVTKRASAVAKRSLSKVKEQSAMMHNIIFTEPATYSPSHRLSPGEHIIVTDDMYKKIIKGGKLREDERQWYNAYVFGKLHSLGSYKFIGDHGNDVAQTGFVDKDIIDRDGYNADIFDSDWFDQSDATRKMIHKQQPSVLWYGETYGGDVGASLYGHKDSDGNYDSLIVDNNLFFPRE
jgi:hypothetical protein